MANLSSCRYFLALLFVPTLLNAGSWDRNVMDAIDVKQAAFCNLVESYDERARAAKRSQNMLKQRRVSEDQSNDLKALIPEQAFSNWVARVDKVELVPHEGDFYVKLTANLPCGVTLVSSESSSAQKISESTTPVIFKQLEKVDKGSFVLVSGEFKNEFKPKDFCISEDGQNSGVICSNLQVDNQNQTVFEATYKSLVMFK